MYNPFLVDSGLNNKPNDIILYINTFCIEYLTANLTHWAFDIDKNLVMCKYGSHCFTISVCAKTTSPHLQSRINLFWLMKNIKHIKGQSEPKTFWQTNPKDIDKKNSIWLSKFLSIFH
jgi:hypothetical protein